MSRHVAPDTTEVVIRRAAKIIQPVFEEQGWTWYRHPERAPLRAEIEDVLWHLLGAVQMNDALSAATGRVRVDRQQDEEGNTAGFRFSLELGHIY